MSASFADPYLLIFRDDLSLLLLQSDESGDLDLLNDNEALSSQTWVCGCLYTDKNGVFAGEKTTTEKTTYLFLLSAEGKLFVSCGFPLIHELSLTFDSGVPASRYETTFCG